MFKTRNLHIVKCK